MSEPRVIRSREEVYPVWDQRSVVIRQQAVGSTIIYPQLPRGVTYQGFDLREHYVLARVRTVREGVLWAERRQFRYGIIGGDVRGPRI